MNSPFSLQEHRGLLDVQDDFRSLDDPTELETFTQTLESDDQPQMCLSNMVVQGMYCAACADAVEAAVRAIPGVEQARLNAATRRIQIRWNPAITQASRWARAAGERGYRLLPSSQAMSLTERMVESRKVMWRLFVAGFCMMQVMMYSWPLYLSDADTIPPDLAYLLRWASWLLTIPVLLFSAQPFFTSAWRDLRAKRIGMDVPVALGILLAFVASSVATFEPDGMLGSDIWFDSVVMLVFFLLSGRFLESRVREKTAGALEALMNRLPDACERQTAAGDWVLVSVRQLKAGDVVRVEPGKAFPGDGEVVSGVAMADESLLTGESTPVMHRPGESVIAGSINLSEWVVVRLQQVGAGTRYAHIVRMMEDASLQKPRMAYLVDRLAAPFLVAIVVVAVLAGWYWWHESPSRALQIAVAVLIVTCPCALSLATPAALLASSGAVAKWGTLVRKVQAFETLAQVKHVVFDKTGTLTREPMTLARAVMAEGRDIELSTWQQWAAAASHSRHPASKALVVHAQSLGAEQDSRASHLQVREEPGMGLVWSDSFSGTEWRLGRQEWVGAADESLRHASQNPQGPVTWVGCNGQCWAMLEWRETVLPDAWSTLHALRQAGLQVHLLSGDHPQSVQRLAQEVGIERWRAGASPEDKLTYVKQLQDSESKVWFIGDGVNDAPVMAQADVSAAIGRGAPLAQAHSDFIIQGQNLTQIPELYTKSMQTMKVIGQNLWWAIAYNLIGIPLAVLGVLTPWVAGLGMAISSLLVVTNALRLLRP